MKSELFQVLSWWIDNLNALSEDQLKVRPAAGGWTPGQLYVHLIIDTGFYIEQIGMCISNSDHADAGMNASAENMFRDHAFPDMRIEGDPSHATMRQPANKAELSEGLLKIRNDMEQLADRIAIAGHRGKTRHPGLGYFGAEEWFLFADMHLRHHQKQLNKFGFRK